MLRNVLILLLLVIEALGLPARSRTLTSRLRWRVKPENSSTEILLQGGKSVHAIQDKPDKLLVVARHIEHELLLNDMIMQDIGWIQMYLSDFPIMVYQVDDPKLTEGMLHRTPANKGNEAMAYLQFIIDNYDHLPATLVFIHGHREGWHMNDKVPLIRRLKWGSHGFANLRHRNPAGNRPIWNCGLTIGFEDCDWEGLTLKPGNLTSLSIPLPGTDFRNSDTLIDSLVVAKVWEGLFQGELGPLPVTMKGPCCSEFLVTRERILAHSKSFYIHVRNYILVDSHDLHPVLFRSKSQSDSKELTAARRLTATVLVKYWNTPGTLCLAWELFNHISQARVDISLEAGGPIMGSICYNVKFDASSSS